MLKLFIDSQEVESPICDDLKIGLNVRQITSPEVVARDGVVRFSIPATAANRVVMKHTD